MAIISVDIVKGVLLGYLKSISAVTNFLITEGSSASEIREINWKGTDFEYPAIRLRIIRNEPDSSDCDRSNIVASWLVFTEDQSSANADKLSGIIASYFESKQFSSSLQGSDYSVSLGRITLVPAFSVGELVWRSEVILEGLISKTT